MKYNFLLGFSGLVAALTLADTAARAQDSDAAPVPAAPSTAPAEATPDPDAIPDVVVFAQRHAVGEVEQRVPIAVTAVDARTVQQTNAVSLADIGALAPNIQTTPVGTFPAFPNFEIRGIGLNSSIRSVDSPINIVQDGMVLVYQAGAIAPTFDLESIEVLRGPQGVLFGRNATGGAIVMRTRLPADQFGTSADLTYGNHNEVDANASVEGPLGTPNILGKVAVLYRSNNGDFDNTNDGIFRPSLGNPTGAPSTHATGDVGSTSEITVKPTFLFKLGGDNQLNLFTQYQHFNDAGTIARNFAPPPGLPLTQSVTDFGYIPTTHGYETNISDPGYLHLNEGHVIAELVNPIGSGVLTTTGAYRTVEYNSTNNFVGTPFPGFLLKDNRERNSEYSLEPRYNISLATTVDLTAGLYFMRSNLTVDENRLTAGPVGHPLATAYLRGDFFQRTDAAAGFANVDWTIIDPLKLSVGGRYSFEKKSIDYTPLAACTDATFLNCKRTPLSADHHWANFSPRAVLSWTPLPLAMVYLSYTKGFRSGDYNPRTTDTTGVAVGPADQETVNTYELGAKTDWFDRRLRLNVSLFQSDYNGIQQVLTLPGLPVIQSLINAANARIRGVEGELIMRPIRKFEIDASAGFVDARYQKFDVPLPGVTNPLDLQFPRVPEWTSAIAGVWTEDVASLNGSFSLRVSYDWRSGFPLELLNTPGLFQKSYGLTDGNLSFNRDNWSVSVFAKNMFNVDYADLKTRSFAWVEYGGEPRTFGIRLTWKQ